MSMRNATDEDRRDRHKPQNDPDGDSWLTDRVELALLQSARRPGPASKEAVTEIGNYVPKVSPRQHV